MDLFSIETLLVLTWLSVSTLACAAAAAVVVDLFTGVSGNTGVCGNSNTENIDTVSGAIVAIKWIDVVLRSVPRVNGLYRWVYSMWQDLLYSYLSRRPSTIYNIRLLPIPFNIGRNAKESRLVQRVPIGSHKRNCTKSGDGGGRLERAWLFNSSSDNLIQYSVKGSVLPLAFIAFYPRNQPSIFPPCPLTTYWRAPSESPVQSAVWTNGQACHEVSRIMLQVLQQCAGPHQQIGRLQEDTDAFQEPHDWRRKQLELCFPHITKPPTATTTKIDKSETTTPTDANATTTTTDATAGTDATLTASERRRLARLQTATQQTQAAHGAHTANDVFFIVITRADQTQASLPTE
jgi:hypothetical protein